MSADYTARRPPRQRVVEGRRGRIGVTSWGPESTQPIVMLHGWMDSGAAFQLLADALPDDWPLMAIDWPGYGHSDPYPGGYWLPEYIADLEWFLDRILPESPVRIIGHSLGGTVASLLAGLRPARLRWLVNLEGLGAPRLEPDASVDHLISWLDALRNPLRLRRYASLDELATTVQIRNPLLSRARARFLASVWSSPVENGVQLLADPLHQLPNPIRYSREELNACIERIACPVLLLIGAKSQYLLRVGGDDLLRHWQQAVRSLRVVTVPDAAHMLHHEQSEPCARHIIEFVAGTAAL